MKIRFSKEQAVKILGLLIIPVVSIVSPYIGIIIMAVTALVLIFKNKYLTLIFFICLLLSQNITLIIGANNFNNISTTIFSLVKEILVYGCVVFYYIKHPKVKKIEILIFIYIIFNIINLVYSSAGTSSKIFSLRQMLLPFICFLFGYVLEISKDEFIKIVDFIIHSALVIGIIGLLEFFVWGTKVWEVLPLWKYQVNKGTVCAFYHDLIPMNFVTFDFLELTGKTLNRLVSTFADPLLTAHYLFLAFLLSDLYDGKKKIKFKLFFAVCALLTLSKGIFLSFILYGVFCIIKRFKYKDMKRVIYCGVVALGGAFAVIYRVMMSYAPKSSTIIHMNGFINAFRIISIFGSGLGTAGTITGILSGTAKELLSAESFIGVLSVQLGYVGLGLFIIIWICIFKSLLWFSKKNTSDKYVFSILIGLVSVIVESLFSESAIAIVGTGLLFIISGQIYKVIQLNTSS